MTLVEFREMFPDLSDYDDSYVQIWLDFANSTVDIDRFGDAYNVAVGNLTAHYVSIDDNAMVSTQKVGGMAVSYGNGEDNSDLSLTIYGRMYYRLCRIYGVGGTVV